MNLATYKTMDPHLLVGLINTELRNHAVDLDDLSKTHSIDLEALSQRLREGGYHYHEATKSFR